MTLVVSHRICAKTGNVINASLLFVRKSVSHKENFV